MYRVPQNHPSFFISKITPSTMIGKNSTVSNTPQIIKFPLNLFASLFGMKAKPMFEADPSAQKAPSVQF